MIQFFYEEQGLIQVIILNPENHRE